MKRLPLLATAALAACTLWAAGCSSADQPAPPPVVAVQAATAQPTTLQQWIRAQAVLFPVQQAIITPRISAPVRRFFVDRGDAVRAGQPLAQLENRDLAAAAQEAAAQLQAAQAAYQTATAGSIPAALQKAKLDLAAAQQAAANAQKVYASRQQLFQQGAVPRRELDQAGVDLTNAKETADLDQQHLTALEHGGHAQAVAAAQADLAAAQARAAAAQAQLSYSRISSPIAGVVADRPLFPGELATPSSPLMTIMDLSQVVAHLSLPADQAALLKVGDAATIQIPSSDNTWPGKVTVVSPATDPGSTTVEIWVQAANPGAALKPGTTVAVAVLARTLTGALTVPASALLTADDGATAVMVIGSDHKAHNRPVTIGVREPGQVQILKGLKPGERVVTVGAYGLADGSLVTLAPSAPAGEPQP